MIIQRQKTEEQKARERKEIDAQMLIELGEDIKTSLEQKSLQLERKHERLTDAMCDKFKALMSDFCEKAIAERMSLLQKEIDELFEQKVRPFNAQANAIDVKINESVKQGERLLAEMSSQTVQKIEALLKQSESHVQVLIEKTKAVDVKINESVKQGETWLKDLCETYVSRLNNAEELLKTYSDSCISSVAIVKKLVSRIEETEQYVSRIKDMGVSIDEMQSVLAQHLNKEKI
ncbi:MAG: hypothetical protein IJU76_08345 [Desulfovibrionaceae bacterium]|nr:hypothetical protein [Desulfovibrionaceae bacterium]